MTAIDTDIKDKISGLTIALDNQDNDSNEEITHNVVKTLKSQSPKTKENIFFKRSTTNVLKQYRDIDTKNTHGLFSVSWSNDNKYIASSTGDNQVVICSTTGSIEKTLKSNDGNYPITTIKWRPVNKLLKTESVLITGGTNGKINYWHVPSGKVLHTIKEENNEIYSLDYRNDGRKFVTAGKDFQVRIYDEATKKLDRLYEKGVMHCRGHSNRIFATKFHPTQPNLVFTAGWDRTVMVWDMRQKECTKALYGPYICGESICLQGDTLITGSWRRDDTIETWDLRTDKKIKAYNWNVTPMVYSMKAHPKYDDIFGVCGTGYNIFRMFNIKNEFRSESISLEDKKGIYSFDFDHNGDFIIIAGDSPSMSVKRVSLPDDQITKKVVDEDPYD